MTVLLRPLVEEDRMRLFAWRNSAEVSLFMYGEGSICSDDHERWFESARFDKDHRYRVIEADGRPVGLIYLTNIDHGRHSCFWGGYIGDPTVRGRGYGKAALRESLQLAFIELKLHKVIIEALAPNTAAIQLYERMGFRREGYLREHVWKNGRASDVVVLSLLAPEWHLLQNGVRSLDDSQQGCPSE